MLVTMRGRARRLTVALAAALWAAAGSWAQPSAAVPTLAVPADFAPAPFALPGSRPAVEKQLSSLLRRLEAIAGADVLISGQPPAAVNTAVVIRTRPGRALTAALAERVAALTLQAVPGASPRGLTITDSAGRLWYCNGCAQTPAAPPPARPWRWLLAAVVLAGAAALVYLRAGRRPVTGNGAGSTSPLARLDDDVLTRLAAEERPELRGVLLAQLPARQAARLRRAWERRGLAAPPPPLPPDPLVVQTVVQALQRKLS